jgi:lysophospholipase L1-like esterase
MILTLSLCAGGLLSCSSQDKNPPSSVEPPKTSDFVIVLPSSPTAGEQAAAEAVRAAAQRLGHTLTVQPDSASEAKHEILVGKTNRSASQEALADLGEGDFTVKMVGDTEKGCKFVLAATDDTGVSFAADYVVRKVLAEDGEGILPTTLRHTYKRADVQIAGTPLSQYTIVYAGEGVGGDKDVEAAKYADTAKVFADLAEQTTGVRPKVVADSGSLPEGKLILFGNTSSRDDNAIYTPKLAKLGTYAVRILSEGHVILAGKNACSALAAGEAFLSAIRSADSEITSELKLSGMKELIRVACVGDSITYGTNSADPSMQNYPVYLQRMLGYDYFVEKFGAPSHSLIETDTQSFLKHDYFKKSTAGDPDVVIVMLGTNDCRTQKWEDSAYKDWSDPARKEAFLTAGQKLIDAYRKANGDVQIIFTTCPTVPQDKWLGTDWTSRIRRYGNPAIRELAKKNDCPVIDIFEFSEDHPEMFEGGDGLHPQNEQYKILAEGVYDLVKDIIKKP